MPVTSFVAGIAKTGNVADSAAIAAGGDNFALMKEEFRRCAYKNDLDFKKKVTVALMWEK